MNRDALSLRMLRLLMLLLLLQMLMMLQLYIVLRMTIRRRLTFQGFAERRLHLDIAAATDSAELCQSRRLSVGVAV